MRQGLQFAIGTALALALCPSANAQRGGHGGGSARVSTPTIVRSAPVQVQHVAAHTRSNITFTTAPGLGFDYVHLAAITRGLSPENLRVVMPQQRAVSPFGLTPFFPVAFPVPVIVIQQPVLVAQAAEEDATLEAAPVQQAPLVQRARPVLPLVRQPQEPETFAAPPEPVSHDPGEYVLVKRDGTVAFAVAFVAKGDQLVYITREGVRRALALSQLDPEATRRFNEERGTSIQLPL